MKTPSDRARAYLAKLPAAISGQGGHNATLRAACELARFGLGDGEALAILEVWNRTHCKPPWTSRELAHKWQSARTKVSTATRLAMRPAPVRVVWKVERKERTQVAPAIVATVIKPPKAVPAQSVAAPSDSQKRPAPFDGQALQNYINQRPSIPKDSILRR